MVTKANVSVDVTDAIQAHIQGAVADALGKDPDALVRAVVETALGEKARSYEKTTIFQKAVNKMIRDAAEEEMRRWLGERKAVITAAIAERLRTGESEFTKRIVDAVESGLAKSFYVSAHMRVEED